MKSRKVMLICMAMALVSMGGMVHAGPQAVQERQGPRIEVKADHVDLGNVKQGEDATHVFDIRNTGDEVLVIQKVQTS